MDLNKLNLDELMGVVNLYPWFGGARKELCERMSRLGDGGWGKSQYADAALYLAERGKLAEVLRKAEAEDCTDADIEQIIKAYISEKEPVLEDAPAPKRKVYAGVGDYFTQEDYDQVRRSDDNVFSRYAAKAKQERSEAGTADMEFDLYTETLAQIYAEQGYYDQAKSIYSKLILAYPEKNAYFAALIQKLEEIN